MSLTLNGSHPAECFCRPPLLQCTVTCGGGVQTRSVHCVQQGRPSSSCLLRQKPPGTRACNTNFCPAPEKRGKKGPHTPVSFTRLQRMLQNPIRSGCAACTFHTSRGCHSHQSPRAQHSLEVYKAQTQQFPLNMISYARGDFVLR